MGKQSRRRRERFRLGTRHHSHDDGKTWLPGRPPSAVDAKRRVVSVDAAAGVVTLNDE